MRNPEFQHKGSWRVVGFAKERVVVLHEESEMWIAVEPEHVHRLAVACLPEMFGLPTESSEDTTSAFRSAQFREFGVIEMTFGDVLRWCPAKHVWVYCALCEKFHFPASGPGSHRESSKHLKKKQWAWYYGVEQMQSNYLPFVLRH